MQRLSELERGLITLQDRAERNIRDRPTRPDPTEPIAPNSSVVW